MNQILDEALTAHDAGLSVIPILPASQHGDKRPATAWKTYQHTHPTREQIQAWFETDRHGLAVICGTISNNLVMLELEGRAADQLPIIARLAHDSGLGELWGRLATGWFETTPSGGFHFYANITDHTYTPQGNQKLAKNTDGEVLAETREQGGYSVIAPTGGTFHHNGQAWTRLAGGPETAAKLTADEYDDLLTLFRTINQYETPTPASTTSPIDRTYDGITPGDAYENDTTWADILTPHGWVATHQHGNETFWRRPGKNHGVSASTGHAGDRDRLYVWTSSTDFEPETPYTKFAAYTVLEHGGDYSRAAKYLADKGYGKQAEHPRDTTGLDALLARGATTQTVESTLPVHEPDHTPNDWSAFYSRTDDGNALRFTDTHTGTYRYIPERNTWAVWDGHKWALDGADASVNESARALIRTLPEDDKADTAHKRRSLSATSIRNMLTLAKTSNGIYTPLTAFDANPYLLNTPAGTVNLHTGRLTPPNPATLCLRATRTPPDPAMPTPRWNNFLAQTFTNDTELISYVQRFFGMSIIGAVHEQILPFMHGAGANGKTTMLNVIQHILGTGHDGYTTTSPAEILMATNRHPTEIAALSGVRLAVISELEEGRHIAEAKAKELTGGDTISARFMGRDFFTFTPTHTLVVLTNNIPETNAGGSPALWRRIKRIPFLNTVPKHQRNPHLEQELLEEAPGILAWIIEGARAYLATGLNEPESVLVATSEYETEQNTVAQFLEEACQLHDANRDLFQIRVAQLRDAYETWTRSNGLEPVGPKSFTQRLKKHGIDSSKGAKGERYYRGISLKLDDETELEEALQ